MKVKLYKYKSLDNLDHIDEIIRDEKLYCATFEELNDAFEGVYQYYPECGRAGASDAGGSPDTLSELLVRKIKEEKRNYRICCLSQLEKSQLMWGYYGDGYKGIVIEVEIDTQAKDIEGVWKLDYISERLTLSNAKTLTAAELLLKKSKDWQHEQEVRVLTICEHLPVSVKRIVLGQRVSENDEKHIREQVVGHNRKHSDRKIKIAKQKMLSLEAR